MIVGTVFTLFVVPVFYLLMAADHHAVAATEEEEEEEAPAIGLTPELA
jgi:multidrug efflux pump